MGTILLIGGLIYTAAAVLILLGLCHNSRKSDEILRYKLPVAPYEHTDSTLDLPTMPQLSDVA